MLYSIDTGNNYFANDMKCYPEVGGNCTLSKECIYYPSLWEMGISFKIKFASDDNYIIVPLEALTWSNYYDNCVIYL